MQRNIKTTVAITFSSFCPKTLHFIATFWQGRGHNRLVIAVCHAHGCDRPSHHPRCLQSCGHTEHGSTLEGGVINAIVLFAFPQTTRILLAHIKQNRDIPLTKEVHDMSARTVLTSGNDTCISGRRLLVRHSYTEPLWQFGEVRLSYCLATLQHIPTCSALQAHEALGALMTTVTVTVTVTTAAKCSR